MRSPARPLSTTVVVLLAAAAIIGYLAGHSRASGASGEQIHTVSASVLLDYPSAWRPVSAAPGIPGLSLTDTVVLAPHGRPAQVGLLVGRLSGGEPSPIPGPFVARMREFPDTEVVNLVEIQAYRYARLSIAGFERKLTVYAIPNPGGDGTVLACYASAVFAAYMRACQQIVATATLVGQPPLYELTPEPAYAHRLSASLEELDGQRVALRREMGVRATPAITQRLAARLAESFANAAASLSALEPPSATRQAQNALANSLLHAREAYSALAVAAGEQSTTRFAAAREHIYEAEAAVNSALESFALLGYQQTA